MNRKVIIFSSLATLTIVLLVGVYYFAVYKAQPTQPVSSVPPAPQVPSAEIQGKELSFETLSKEAYSGYEHRLELVVKIVPEKRRDYEDIRVKQSFEWLWGQAHSKISPKPELPSINFDKEMILAVFQGRKESSQYNIGITKVIEHDKMVEVLVKEVQPSSGQELSAEIVQPYHIIKTKRIDKEVRFSYLLSKEEVKGPIYLKLEKNAYFNDGNLFEPIRYTFVNNSSSPIYFLSGCAVVLPEVYQMKDDKRMRFPQRMEISCEAVPDINEVKAGNSIELGWDQGIMGVGLLEDGQYQLSVKYSFQKIDDYQIGAVSEEAFSEVFAITRTGWNAAAQTRICESFGPGFHSNNWFYNREWCLARLKEN